MPTKHIFSLTKLASLSEFCKLCFASGEQIKTKGEHYIRCFRKCCTFALFTEQFPFFFPFSKQRSRGVESSGLETSVESQKRTCNSVDSVRRSKLLTYPDT